MAWAVWNTDDAERLDSSSGGVFSLLARRTLAQGGAVFGAALDGTMAVRHVCAHSEEELAPLRGSKYVQSDLGDSFRQVKALLEEGTQVLFTGTPCQVDGLKRYLGKDDPNLLTCDLVCHGVPSPAVYRAWLDGLERARGSKATNVRFRDKTDGWQKARLTVDFADGSQYAHPLYETPFGRGFGSQLFLRPCCTRCRYAGTEKRPADLTLADFWGLDEKAELPTDRAKGISLVLAHTARGQAALDGLAGQAGRAERPLAEAVAGNPRLSHPVSPSPRRPAFFSAFAALPFSEVEKRFLSRPSLPYRAASRVLTPAMKEKIRKVLK